MALPLLGLAANLLPSLASWAFGKTGEAVATAVAGAAQDIFGTDDKDAIEKSIAANPELAFRFKEKLLDIRDREAARAHTERLAELNDGKDARSMFVKVGGLTVPALSLTTVVLFFISNGMMLIGLYFLLSGGKIEVKNVELWIAAAGIVGQIMGYINAKTDQVYGFYYGSTVSARSNAQASQTAVADIAKAIARK